MELFDYINPISCHMKTVALAKGQQWTCFFFIENSFKYLKKHALWRKHRVPRGFPKRNGDCRGRESLLPVLINQQDLRRPKRLLKARWTRFGLGLSCAPDSATCGRTLQQPFPRSARGCMLFLRTDDDWNTFHYMEVRRITRARSFDLLKEVHLRHLDPGGIVH